MQMGLLQNMRDAIMHCILSCTFKVLWNEQPTDKFLPMWAIRQGDPHSPYIFVACIERLSQLTEMVCWEGRWKAFPTSKGGPRITTLFFADDVVLFMEVSKEQANMVKECLDRLCNVSSWRVSAQKSTFYFHQTLMRVWWLIFATSCKRRRLMIWLNNSEYPLLISVLQELLMRRW